MSRPARPAALPRAYTLLDRLFRLWDRLAALYRTPRDARQKTVRFTLEAGEDRSAPGNILDALLGITTLESLIPIPGGGTAGYHTGEIAALQTLPPDDPTGRDVPEVAGEAAAAPAPTDRTGPAAEVVPPAAFFGDDPPLVDTALVGPPSDDATPAALVARGGTGEVSEPASPGIPSSAPTGPGVEADGDDGGSPLASGSTPNGGLSMVSPGATRGAAAPPGPSSTGQNSAPPLAGTVPGGLGHFGLVTHKPHQPGVSPVSDGTAFAPTPKAAGMSGGHRHQLGLSGAAGQGGTNHAVHSAVGRRTDVNPTGTVGAASPAVFLANGSRANPVGATARLPDVQGATARTNPILAPTRGGRGPA